MVFENLTEEKAKEMFDKLVESGMSEDDAFTEVYSRECNKDETVTKYYICGIGYDADENITDTEKTYDSFFGLVYDGFDDVDTAKVCFAELCKKPAAEIFEDFEGIAKVSLQLEECEEDEDSITCINIVEEVWMDNPNM